MEHVDYRAIRDEWVRKYREVYVTEYDEVAFVWRPLSRAEFRNIAKTIEVPEEQFDEICRLCLLDPVIEDFDELPAGIPEALSKEILYKSGYGEDNPLMKKYEFDFDQEMQMFEHQVSCVVKFAFPDLSLEEIESWGLEKTMWYYSRAKWMLETFRGIKLEESKNQ